jgi:exonuclease VII small subunit
VKFCTKALDTAEQKVKILQKDENGELTEAPFAVKSGE